MSIEDSPEFKKALNEACEREFRGYLYGGEYVKAASKDEIASTMLGMQKQRKEIESRTKEFRIRAEALGNEARMMSNPHVREINKIYKQKYGSKNNLICPVCGEGDHGNKMNGKPYCFMNAKHKGLGPIPLMTPEKAKDWKPPKKKVTMKQSWALDISDIVKARKKKK